MRQKKKETTPEEAIKQIMRKLQKEEIPAGPLKDRYLELKTRSNDDSSEVTYGECKKLMLDFEKEKAAAKAKLKPKV